MAWNMSPTDMRFWSPFVFVRELFITLRPTRNTVGYIGELIAMLLLKMRLHKILCHRYKTHMGEIDIISLRGKSLFFIEVKTSMSRSCSTDIPLTARQRTSIIRVAKLFLFRNPHLSDHEISFEICRISLTTGITWIKNAWHENGS